MTRCSAAIAVVCLALVNPVRTALAAQATSPQNIDITLGEAIQTAMRQSRVVQAAQYLPAQAAARTRQVRAALRPSINVQGADGQRTINSTSLGFSFPTLPGQPPLFNSSGEVLGPRRTLDYRGRLTVPLIDLAVRERIRSTKTLVNANTKDVAVTADQAGTDAAFSYIHALRAEAEYRARGADSVLVVDLLRMAKQQLQAGVGLPSDVTRAEAKLSSTLADLITARCVRDRMRLNLLRILNLPSSTLLTFQDSLESLPFESELRTDEQTAINHALANRPDLQAATERIAAIRQSMTAIRAEQLPSLQFAADYGVNGSSYSHMLGTYSYSLIFSASIFDGALRRGRIQEQAAQLGETEIQYQALRDQIETDVRGILLDATSAKGQIDAAREGVRLADEEVAQARDRVQKGSAGNSEVNTALLNRTTARIALIDALAAAQNTRIALAQVQGIIAGLL